MAGRLTLKIGRPTAILFAALLLPTLIVLALPTLAGWQNVVPVPFKPADPDPAVPEILASLSSDLNAIAVAALIGIAALLRDWRGRDAPRRLWVTAAVAASAAVGSCYAGFRFRFQLAEQISLIPLDLALVGDRLASQGFLLLIAAIGIIYMALVSFLLAPDGRDGEAA